MRDHPQSVNSGIGPPRAMKRDAMAENFFQRVFNRRLDRRSFGLPLPAGERLAVEFDEEFDSAILFHGTRAQTVTSEVRCLS